MEDYNSIKTCIIHHPVYCLHAANGDECYPDCSVVWQEQKSSVETIISCHSSTCSVIFKHTCLLSALFSAILFGPSTESSSGLDSGRQEEYCSRERMMRRRLCWGVTCVVWFLIMYEGRSFNSIIFSCCLWICWSNINIMATVALFFLDTFKGIFWVN